MAKSLFRTWVLAIAGLMSLGASAHHFAVDNIYYDSIPGTDNCLVTYDQATKKGNVYNCYSDTLVIPSQVTYEGRTFTVTQIGKYAVRNSSGLKAVTIPRTIELIGYGAFSKCSSLTSVLVPGSVKTMDAFCFNDCPLLSSVIVEEGVETIGQCAFFGDIAMNTFTIPTTVKTLDTWAFRNCITLAKIIIPAKVEKIGNNCFQGCVALKSLTVNSANTHYAAVSNVLMNKAKTIIYLYPDGLPATVYTVPNTIEEIAFSAFNEHPKLKAVYLPKSLRVLNNSAFDGCEFVGNVNLPPMLQSIGNGTFRGCKAMKWLVIPDSVKSLDSYSFQDCSLLERVTLGKGISALPKQVFAGDTLITEIRCLSAVPPTVGTGAFDEKILANTTVIVPKGCIEAYKAAEGWQGFAQYAELPDRQAMEYVDLGLTSGTKWGKMNIGAQTEGQPGIFVAWGETSERTAYGWADYKWANGSNTTMTKYCVDDTKGTVDSLKSLLAADDVARLCCDGEMPTLEDVLELKSQCKFAMIWLDNLKALQVTGPNGNTILLPAAGFMLDDKWMSQYDQGYFWTSSLYTKDSSQAYAFRYTTDRDKVNFTDGYRPRNYGHNIRPVLHAAAGVNDITASEASQAQPVEVYNLSGQRLAEPARGLNIIRYSDGTVRKVMVR